MKSRLLPQIYENESTIKPTSGYKNSITNYFEKDNILLDMSEEYNNIIWDPFSEMLRDPDLRILHKPEESRLETIWYNVHREKTSVGKNHTLTHHQRFLVYTFCI